MKLISAYSKYLPYIYFIAIIVFWFTDVNRHQGIIAYPILIFGVPFLWQLIKPNQKVNFTIGITFVCLSSYLILAYLSGLLKISIFSDFVNYFVVYGGFLIIANFVMALWIIRNSLKRSF